jgi:ABC-type antimicrobial peptide transport system permease subunit
MARTRIRDRLAVLAFALLLVGAIVGLAFGLGYFVGKLLL